MSNLKLFLICLLILSFVGLVFLSGCINREGISKEIKPNINMSGKKILMVIAPVNFRDEEFLEPKKVFENSGASVEVASKDVKEATSMIEKIKIKVDLDIEEVNVTNYDAMQLKDILQERVKIALKPGICSEGVISKCAAIAAQDQGDARRALDLLRVATEIAERNEDIEITENHVTIAEQKLELDRVVELAKVQPKHSQLTLYSILKLFEKGTEQILTGDVYEIYYLLCKRNGYRFLTQRRVSDLISELDMLGLISTKVVSKGRYGRTREIRIAIAKKPFDVLKSYFSNLFEI